MRKLCLLMTLGLWLAAAPAFGSDATAAGGKAAGAAAKTDGDGRAADPLANLKPYEERRYRVDMQDCAKEKGADRRVCERAVHRKAAAKSRRRSAAGH